MANRLKAVRTERGLSKSGLSRLSGVSRPTIDRIESGTGGNVKTGTLVRLAAALELPLSELFF